MKAQPGARRNGVVGEYAGSLKVAVTPAPEKGKANEAIIEVLADLLELKRGLFQLVAGATSSRKAAIGFQMPSIQSIKKGSSR